MNDWYVKKKNLQIISTTVLALQNRYKYSAYIVIQMHAVEPSNYLMDESTTTDKL